MDGEKIEDGAYQNDNGKQYHHTPDNAVDENDTIIVEFYPDFVNEPCQSKPPQQCTHHDTHIAYEHHERMPRNHESQLCKAGHKKNDDEWIGEGHQKGRHAIVDESALGVAALVHVLSGVGAETVDAENEEHDASRDLQEELVVGIGDEIHDKTHAYSCDDSIKQVAHRGAYACHKAIPPSFVERALHTQYSHRSHGRRGKNTYDDAFEDGAEYVYVKQCWHIVCKDANFL